MMKTKIVFPFLLLLLACLTGCMHDEDNLGNANPQGSGRVLTVNYSFDIPTTRVTSATSDERQINDVAILFYKSDADPNNETYIALREVTPPTNSVGSFAISLPEAITAGEEYKLIAIANHKNYKPKGYDNFADYVSARSNLKYNTMQEQIFAALDNDTRIIMANLLPFYGRPSGGSDGDDITLIGPSDTNGGSLGVSVRFSRIVARFNVENYDGGSLKIMGVKVCNYRNEGYYFLENVAKGDIVRGLSDDGYEDGGYEKRITNSVDGMQQSIISGGLYALPNTVSYISQDDWSTTYLMIAGKYKGDDDNDYSEDITYYRVNIGQNGNSQLLRRNYIYTIVINSVSRAGASTEQEASSEKDKLIDYIVDDEWEDNNGGGTVVDEHGNFLTVSHSTVILPGTKDASATVNVRVKESTGWEVELSDGSPDDFKFEKISDNSFVITTKENNTGLQTRNAKFTVKVTGIPGTLSQEVRVIQLSQENNDAALLMVDGKTSDLTYNLPGQGGIISLPVVTGSALCRWKVYDPYNTFLSYYTPEGANNGILEIKFPPNTSGGDRSGTIIVKRLDTMGNPDNSINDIEITFMQEKSPYVVAVLPAPPTDKPLVLDGFIKNSHGGTKVNYVATWHEFRVLIADPDNFPTYTITSSFNQESDAFVTSVDKNTTNKALYQAKKGDSKPSSINVPPINNIFWLNIYLTGPGDEPINGEITIVAKHKSGDPNLNVPYSFPVKIVSGCKVGDARISTANGNILVADRNVGAQPREEDSVGRNYTPDQRSIDSNEYNRNFIGSFFYSLATSETACSQFGANSNYTGKYATAWRVPNNYDYSALNSYMCHSKGRAFVVSTDESKGLVGCWFPMYEASSSPNVYQGVYRTTQVFSGPTYYSLKLLSTGTGNTGTIHSTSGTSVTRCVHSI